MFSRYKPTLQWTSSGRPAVPPIKQVAAPPPRSKLSLPVVSLVCIGLLAVWLTAMAWSRAWGKLTAAACILGVVALVTWPYGRVEVPDPFIPRLTLSDEEAASIFAALHKNVYRAFDYHRESDIYDALAGSVDGELLEKLYLQIQKGLEMQEQGGAISRIRRVKILDGRKRPLPDDVPAEQPGFGFRSTWTVAGTVEHWGHIHARTNEYTALFAVQSRNGAWKITDVQVLGEKRIKYETRLRKLNRAETPSEG